MDHALTENLTPKPLVTHHDSHKLQLLEVHMASAYTSCQAQILNTLFE